MGKESEMPEVVSVISSASEEGESYDNRDVVSPEVTFRFLLLLRRLSFFRIGPR